MSGPTTSKLYKYLVTVTVKKPLLVTPLRSAGILSFFVNPVEHLFSPIIYLDSRVYMAGRAVRPDVTDIVSHRFHQKSIEYTGYLVSSVPPSILDGKIIGSHAVIAFHKGKYYEYEEPRDGVPVGYEPVEQFRPPTREPPKYNFRIVEDNVLAQACLRSPTGYKCTHGRIKTDKTAIIWNELYNNNIIVRPIRIPERDWKQYVESLRKSVELYEKELKPETPRMGMGRERPRRRFYRWNHA